MQRRWAGLAAAATVCVFAGVAQSAVVGSLAAGRLLDDGHWLEQWGGHLRLHLHDVQWQLPWSEMLSSLLVLDAALFLTSIALALLVRSSGHRALLLGVLALVSWSLAVPLEFAGRHGEIDEPSSVDVHILCTHPVEGRLPGLFRLSSSWFASC